MSFKGHNFTTFVAKTIYRQDFEDLYFLPNDKLGKIVRRIILINYWNEEEIGKMTYSPSRTGGVCHYIDSYMTKLKINVKVVPLFISLSTLISELWQLAIHLTIESPKPQLPEDLEEST